MEEMNDPSTAMKHFYRFTYSNMPHSAERASLFQVRDGMAFMELTAPLPRLDWTFGTTIHNYQDQRLPAEHFAFLQPDDIVVMATRPPLNDRNEDRRKIRRSDNHLEQMIFKQLKYFFDHITRYNVSLSKEMANMLSPKEAHTAELEFHANSDGIVTEARAHGSRHRHPIKGAREWCFGYFLHCGPLEHYGSNLMVSFAVSGNENLLFNRLIRTRYSEWLREPVFAFVRFARPLELEKDHLTVTFADSLTAEVLIEHKLSKEAVRSKAKISKSNDRPGRSRQKAFPHSR
jgi:hypothetical protein